MIVDRPRWGRWHGSGGVDRCASDRASSVEADEIDKAREAPPSEGRPRSSRVEIDRSDWNDNLDLVSVDANSDRSLSIA